MIQLAPEQVPAIAAWFAEERVCWLVGSHLVHTGHGAAWADRWPAPRALLAEVAGNYSLTGDAAALRPADLPPLAGFIEAAAPFVPLLRAARADLFDWPRVILSLPPAADLDQARWRPTAPALVRPLTPADGSHGVVDESSLFWEVAMRKQWVCFLTLALVLAACSPAADPLATAQSAAPTSAPTSVIAITAQEGTAILGTAVLGTATAFATTNAANAATATQGGPVVITVEPANGTPQAGATALPAPAATPIPTLPAGLAPSELKYHVLAAFPDIFFCDPDFYPVARGDEAAIAEARFPELQANTEEFQAILHNNNLAGLTRFSADQKLLIYRAHKKLTAVRFKLSGDQYQFQLQTKNASGQGLLVTGQINGQGVISAQQSQPGVATCPICLAAQTQIDTPRGPLAVIDLRPGDWVWTVDASGARVAAPIVQTGHMPVPATHQMVHLTLSDGRQLLASPGHPTSDGRLLGQLALGDTLDGARITQLERVPYGQPATYDLLPASATGFYWANGILIGSTLK